MDSRKPIIHIEIDPSTEGRYGIYYHRDHPCIHQNAEVQIDGLNLRHVSEDESRHHTTQMDGQNLFDASNNLYQLKYKLEKFQKFQNIGYLKSQATFVRTLAEAYVEDFDTDKTLLEIAFDISMKTLLVVHSSIKDIEAGEKLIINQETHLFKESTGVTSEFNRSDEMNKIQENLSTLRNSATKLAKLISDHTVISADLLPVITTPMVITIKGSDEGSDSIFTIPLLSETTLKLLAEEHDKNSDLKFQTKVDTCIQRAEYLFSNNETNHPLSREDFDPRKNDNRLQD